MGGTMRLGADPVKLHEGTKAREIFGEAVIYKRHRHRYEVNNQLRRRLEDEGLVCGGTSPDERLVEMVELPDHPFFVASQYHPEFNSRPNRPEPLFREFVGAAATHAGAAARPTSGELRGDRREARARATTSASAAPPEARPGRSRLAFSAMEEIPAARDLRPALRDPQPDRRGARDRRHPRRRAAGAGARGERGRRRRSGRSRGRQPAGAARRERRGVGDVLRPRRHGPAPGPGRGGRTTKASSAAAARRSSAPTTRPRSRSSWSWSPATSNGPAPVGIELVLTVAEEQGLRGAKAFDASQLRSRVGFVLDHAGAGRRGDRRDPDPAEDPRRLHRGRGPRRDQARGRQQRDRRRGGGDRADGARPARRGDDRQRRPDRRRHLGQRRARATAGSTPRRAASTPSARPRWRGRSPTPAPGARASTAATSTCGSKSSSAATRCRRTRRRWRWPRRGCAAAGLEPRRVAIGGGSDANVFRRDGFDCVLLANGTDAVHTADEMVPARSLEKMLEVCEGIVAAAAAAERE